MNKADKLNLSNLVDSVRKMENATKTENNTEEIKSIRQYCIDAMTDYEDTVKTICDIINKNRDLWANPYIYGSYDGFCDQKEYRIHGHTVPSGFHFETGSFGGGSANGHTLNIVVNGIYGTKISNGFGSFKDHFTETKNWHAIGIFPGSGAWDKDLTNWEFTSTEIDGSTKKHESVTSEDLKKYNWQIDGWIILREKAEKTRLRTRELVDAFKAVLKERIKKSGEKVGKITEYADSHYAKIGF